MKRRTRYRGLYIAVLYIVTRDGYIAVVEKRDGTNVWSSARETHAYPDSLTAELAAKRIIDEMRQE